jgi:hypothetical protein
MENSNFKEKLHERIVLLVGQHKSQNEMARIVGVSKSAMSAYLLSKEGFKVPMAIVENYPDISLEWLFRGDGAMLLGHQEPAEPEPEAKPLPHPGADPRLVQILLDRIEQQAVTISQQSAQLEKLQAENDELRRFH